MRDKKRIKRMMDKLTKLWEQNPDFRFYQFFINIGMMPDHTKLWYMEDNETEKYINEKGMIKK